MRNQFITAALVLAAAIAAPACIPAQPGGGLRSSAPSSNAGATSPGQQAGRPDLPEQPEENDPIVVRGQHSTLTRDNAIAFYETLIFTLTQLGHGATAEQVSPDRVIGELAARFDSASRDDQMALASWRKVWTAVQARWDELPLSDKQAFVHVVLVASFGEQAAGQLDGTAGQAQESVAAGGGGPSSSDDDDSLTPSFDDPGSGCWSSSGCHLGAVSGDHASGQY